MRDFWTEFSATVGETKNLRITHVIDELEKVLEPHIFPPGADGVDPRKCPSCEGGRLNLKLGKFGAFIGCTNYPECRFTKQMGASEGDAGPQDIGEDPATGEKITLRTGRYGPYVQRGEGDKPKTNHMARALAFRVGFSILLFVCILVAWKLGYINPTGIPLRG